MHCTLFSERDESFLCVNLDGSKTDPFRGGLDVWLADLDVVILSPVFCFQRYDSSLFSAGLNRGKAQAMFRWANGEMVTREKFVAGARQLLAQSGVDDGSRFKVTHQGVITYFALGCPQFLYNWQVFSKARVSPTKGGGALPTMANMWDSPSQEADIEKYTRIVYFTLDYVFRDVVQHD
eukprot:g47914.t1